MTFNFPPRLRCGTAAFALAAALCGPASAQDALPPVTGGATAAEARPAPADVPASGAEEGDVIVVTGSRIARPNIENSTPTLVVGAETLANRGLENFADLATQLPQFAPSYGTSRTQSTFSGAASSGLNLINLRNLGGGRTLTLVNGRRYPAGTTTSTAVDFNSIPTANIERVDVITGGASAIYGADAVAGVVNVVTRKNFEGLEAGASYGISQRGDNRNPSGYLMFGAKFGDGGRFTATGQVDYQGFVGCSSRFICAQDFLWNPPAAAIRGPAAYSAVGANPTFFLVPANGLPAINATRVGSDLSYTGANGALIPFVTARDGFNRNAARTLAIPTKRLLFAAEADYPVADGVNLFAEFNFANTRTNAAFEGHPFQSTAAGSLFGGGPGVAGLQASIPVDNPFVPAAIRAAAVARGQTVIQWQQRFNAIDSRGARNERTTYRVAAGVRGDFELGVGRNWQYEVSYVYGRTKLDSLTRGLVSTRQLYYGLRVEADPANPGQFRCADAGARASGCVPINPFVPLTPAMQSALSVAAGQSGASVLNDAQAFVSGGLFALPGGDLSVAAGVEYRTFSGFLDYDQPINNAEVTGNQIGDVGFIKTKTKEAFAEVVAPILGDLPFAYRLTLEGAYRISDPNRGGNYKTWRYGGTWEPFEGIRLRAVRARAVRTPVPGELSGVSQTFGTVNDPCIASLRNANATRAANCLADGVPAGYTPPQNVLQSVGGFIGGNPDLQPEKATTLTYGVALTPRFLPGFSLTVDRFEIELDGIINTVGRQLKANRCYDTTDRQFCGDLTRGTNPNVPGAGYVLTGVNDQLINVAALTIKGIDVDARYAFPLGPGRVSLSALGTIYTKASQIPLPGQASVDLLGFAGGSTSDQGFVKFTGNGNIGYALENGLGFNYNLRYIGKTKTSPFVSTPPYPRIGDRYYHNVRFSVAVDQKYQFYFGVDNVADSGPPFFPSSTAGTQALDTVPAFYDIFGRSFYAGVKVNF